MPTAPRSTVLVVRGAGPAGRCIAERVTAEGGLAIVLDERTGAHPDVPSLRVAFDDLGETRRAIDTVTSHHGSLHAIVLLPPLPVINGAAAGSAWERYLGRELTNMAGLVRAAAPALGAGGGVVVPVAAPPRPDDPTDPAALVGEMLRPVLLALAARYGLRVAPIVTDARGAARGEVVASHVVAHLPGRPPVAASRDGRRAPAETRMALTTT